jgi:isoleucyl-tRNA synthetase
MADEIKVDGKNSFKDTLNLPRTDFPIRTNAMVDDPAMIKRWNDEELFAASFTHNKGKPAFIFHDGPPYANGNIHLGSAYNKMLKDIACKAQRMSGKHVPVTPGWDCHGLPIESKVSKEFPGLSSQALKKECRAYAQKWVNIQREEFKQLGVLMNWDSPYLTMDPAYEASILQAFATFVEKGFIQKKSKTVPWCFSCQTVLASAEIEYQDRKDPSVYVLFTMQKPDSQRLFPEVGDHDVSFLVWTTTPWTLPLNRAVLIKPDTTYQLLHLNGDYILVAQSLADGICKLVDQPKTVVAQVEAQQFLNLHLKHPFIDGLAVPVLLDNSVSVQEGTAAVHCAPGCGPDDYEVGVKNNLEIYSPITVDGKYSYAIEPHELDGMSVVDGQGWVITKLLEKKKLLFKQSIKHSYPHCWRCRNGLIFRATNQWFLDLSHDSLRQKAIDAIEQTLFFLPKRSQSFLKATISGRLEWCLSRQRSWGVPIPALLCKNCDYPYINADFVHKIAQEVATKGVEYWDEVSVESLAPDGLVCQKCNHDEFVKERDILDVWFDSGISHYAVLYHNKQLGYPADLYIEGIDQHRGWFQSSLLTSLVIEGKPCVKTIVTHGYTVDEKGQKMSKSLGNVITPDEIIAKIGTDGLRLWASSIDIGADPIVSQALLKNIAEVYRKIRNTARFLLSNLYDFDIATDKVALDELLLIDRYALEYLFHLNLRIRSAYEVCDFTAVFHELADYCAKELSSFYLDIIKDRLYVEKSNGLLRRSAQTACWYILDSLTKLIAPILSLCAEDISDHYQKNKLQSIHLQDFPELHDVWDLISKDVQLSPDYSNWYPYKAPAQEAAHTIKTMNFHVERNRQWQLLHAIRSALLKAIEEQREKGLIKHPLEVKLSVHFNLPKQEEAWLDSFLRDLHSAHQTKEQFFKEMMVVSQFHIVRATTEEFKETPMQGLWALVTHAQGEKCPRCWQWDTKHTSNLLCNRCQSIV